MADAREDCIVLQLLPLPGDRPVEVRLRLLLKDLLRRQQFRCLAIAGPDVPEDLAAAVAGEEVRRLQGIIDGLAARIAAQAELLAQRAAKEHT